MSRLRRGVALVQEGSLYALLFLLPFSKAAVEILFGFIFFGWLFQRLDPRTRTDTLWLSPALRPLALALVSYLGVCALSIAPSTFHWLSLRGFVGKWLEYLLYFVMVADLAVRPRVVKRCLRVLVYSAAFVLIEALTQERYGNGFFLNFRLDFFSRMTGPYENPIDLATYLMVVIPTLMAFATVRRKANRWPLWGVILLLSACLVRTKAVGAWLGIGVGLLMMVVLKTTVRKPALVLLVTLALSGGTVLSLGGRFKAVQSLSDIGMLDRWHMWQAALKMIGERPVLGFGLNTFMANYLDHWVGGQQLPRYAHNCYLQVAAETGLPGLLTFLALLYLFFARVLGALPRLRPNDQSVLVGLTAGLLAFAVQSAVDTNFYALRQAALFWVLAGLALGLSSRSVSPAPQASPGSRQKLVA
ncbi:MAG: O-antigen ligase family protein [Candidatus Omnitrophota bacterium]|nr:O-antigen ligase family protein [Candidatus Omnitrophota bacterium]